MRVAFVGLGAMGRHLAANVARAGHTVRGYDARPDALAGETLPAGLSVVGSLPEALEGAECLVTSLPDTPQVEEVVLGEGGALETLGSGAVVVDMSTISPVATRRMADRLAEAGIAFLDAPVSGGVRGATEGTLTIMVGGDELSFRRVRPLLSAMGKTITHFGASGNGQVVKLCNQVVCTMHIQAVCEAIALARAAGVDVEAMRGALMGGAAASWIMDNLGPLIVAKDDRPNFRIELQAKDLRLAEELAASLNLPLPGASLVTSLYRAALANGDGGLGNQSLYRTYDRLTGQSER